MSQQAPHGKTNRSTSPSSVIAAGSWAGNVPFHEFHIRGTSRVCAAGTSAQSCAASSRRKTEKAGAAGASPRTSSDFHSNKLAASFSVNDSCGSRHKIHPAFADSGLHDRSEEHTYELQSLR